ncbi:MAG TPA: MFS transporter [Dongiaceae bacterium]|nr:MFS transporter [Dongiaceae bacterium]
MHDRESPENLPDEPAPKPVDESAYAVLKNADFTRYLTGRFVASLGQQMLVVAIDWELYQRTHSALALAFVGLSLMIPMILCTIPAGHFADVFNRKKIILTTTLILAAASLGLTLLSYFAAKVFWIYVCLFVLGAARTFLWPASAAFVTSLVLREQFSRAVTFNSGAFQLSSVLGPVAFGALIALTPHAEARATAWSVYALNILASLACFALVMPIKHIHKVKPAEPVSAKSLVEGFRFVYQNKIILGVITLDLFAVLLGGAVTILPMFANDIFHTGAPGLGWLRNAMAVGAVICALIIAHRPPLKKAGKTMLLSVAIFGVATIIFGVANKNCFGNWLALPNSFWFWFSFTMLALAGFVDNISVVVRQTLVQILTPDEKRGRVSAVNSLFIGTSNELGGFRSGIVAWLFASPTVLGNAAATGAIVSTVTGGIGTILVVLAVAWIWPEIRKYGKLA